MSSENPELPVCYYNGACPVCRFEIEHYKRGPDSDRVVWLDLAAEPEALARFGVDRAGARRRLHVVDEDGRLHVGVAAFILIWRRMPRYRWLSRLVGTWPLRPLADKVYDHGLAPLLFHWNRMKGRI